MFRALCLSVVFLCVDTTFGEIIDYDCDVVPDHATLQDVFSTQVSSGASWTSNNSELTMTTVSGEDVVWFGNHLTQDPVPWDLANNSDGNTVSMRSKWTASSTNWNLFLSDDAYFAQIYMSDDATIKLAKDGGFDSIAVDATTYHTYSVHLAGGSVTYTIDSTDYTFTPGTYTQGKHLIIGDSSGTPLGTGSGSMIIDYVNIQTVPEPSTIAMWSIFSVIGLAVWRRRKKA